MINVRITHIVYFNEFLIMIFVLILSPIFINGITLGVDEYDVTAKAQEDKTWEILNHAYIDVDTVFYDIKFLNETHGWVVGDIGSTIHKGVVLHTNDSGDTWCLQLYKISHDFVQIEIIDANNIWVAGIGSLFHTSNGGFTWDEYPVVETRSGLSTVEFVNLTHGWTATKNDLFYTQDGGITWANNTSWKFNDIPRQMYFVTSLDVWAIGFYGIYQSIDGGYTWTQRYDRGGWSMSFISDNEAWAVADDMLVHMTDGITWMEQNMPRPSSLSGLQYPYFTDVVFKDRNHGWLVGLETPIAYTPDGGITWYEQSAQVEPRQRVMAVDFLNQTHGWAAGYNGLIMRTHRGDSADIPLTTNVDKLDISILISISMVSIVAIVLFIIYRKVTN